MHDHDTKRPEANLLFLVAAAATGLAVFYTFEWLLDPRGIGGFLFVIACTWGTLILLALLVRWHVRLTAQR